MTETTADLVQAAPRQFTVTRDAAAFRVVNDTTKRTIMALTRREAKHLSKELKSVLKKKNGPKS